MNKKKKSVVIAILSILLIALIGFFAYIYFIWPHTREAKQPVVINPPAKEQVLEKPKENEILLINSGNLATILCSIPFKAGDISWTIKDKKFSLKHDGEVKELRLDKDYKSYNDNITAFESYYLLKIELQEDVEE